MRMNLQRGQALMEILVVILVISLALISILNVSTKSVASTDYSRTKTLANQAAQEAIEWLRSERDASYTVFYNDRSATGAGQTYCLADLNWTISGSCGATQFIPGTNLKREVTLSRNGPRRVIVRVDVIWTDGNGEHLVTTETLLGSW